MEENIQDSISAIIREVIKSELNIRKIDLKYLDYEEVEKLINDEVLKIQQLTGKKVENILLEIGKIHKKELRAEKSNNKITRETKREIKERFIINGETPEEIRKSGLNITDENLEELYKKCEDLIILAQAMPVKELVARKVKRESFETDKEYKKAKREYSYKCYYAIKNNGLSNIIRVKKEQILSRLLAEESLDQIVADRELNVCREAVEYMQKELNLILFAKAMPVKELVARKVKRESFKTDEEYKEAKKEYSSKCYYAIKNNGLSNIIRAKKEQIQSRLLAGESLEQIVADRELDVCKEAVESIQNKIKKGRSKKRTQQDRQKETIEKASRVDDIETNIIDESNKESNEENEILHIIKQMQQNYKRLYNKKILNTEENNLLIDKELQNIFVLSTIDTICSQLSNGTLDIKTAEEMINAEAKNQIQNGSKSKFALTEEQAQEKVLVQIKQNLVKNASNYPVKNPQSTITSLSQLTGEDEEAIFEVIVNNLIENEQFDSAKEICCYYNQIASKQRDDMLFKETNALARKIRNYELGNIIPRALQLDTELENSKFWESIIDGIEREKIKLEAVPLGKSEDGTKRITLGDIWPNNKNRTH